MTPPPAIPPRPPVPDTVTIPTARPLDVDAEGVAYWGDHTGSFVSAKAPDGDTVGVLDGVSLESLLRIGKLTPGRAEQIAAWLITAAHHAQPDTITVTVRDTAAEAPWGYGFTDPKTRTVTVSGFCPVCGGRRGDRRGQNACEDGAYYWVEQWDNMCGHVDRYDDVIREAARLKDAAGCRCVVSCADDPPTACSLSGISHVHPDDGSDTFGRCPVHPDAPGDL